jgi:hypothetical protein
MVNIMPTQMIVPGPDVAKYQKRHLLCWMPFGRQAVDFNIVRMKHEKFMNPYAVRKHIESRGATRSSRPMRTKQAH